VAVLSDSSSQRDQLLADRRVDLRLAPDFREGLPPPTFKHDARVIQPDSTAEAAKQSRTYGHCSGHPPLLATRDVDHDRGCLLREDERVSAYQHRECLHET
jgi:hypothetical protein